MSELVCCRYNPSHRVKSSRLMFHEDKCPDKNNIKIRVCLYNPNHKVSREKFDQHLKECPNRPNIDNATEERMKLYVENKLKSTYFSSKDNIIANYDRNEDRSSDQDIRQLIKQDEIKKEIKEEVEKIPERKIIKKEEDNKNDIKKEAKAIKRMFEDAEESECCQITKTDEGEYNNEKFLNKKIKAEDDIFKVVVPKREDEDLNKVKVEEDKLLLKIFKKEEEILYEGEDFNNFF